MKKGKVKLLSAAIMLSGLLAVSPAVADEETFPIVIDNKDKGLITGGGYNNKTLESSIYKVIDNDVPTSYDDYVLLQLNPDEMAENLDKSRGYIPGITPGEATSKYLKYVISRLTVFGTLGLMILAALPIIFSKVSNLSSNVTIGGTGLLIVVGVALETYKQLESSIVSRSYTGTKKRRRR